MEKFSLVGTLPFILRNGFVYEPGELTKYCSNISKNKGGNVLE